MADDKKISPSDEDKSINDLLEEYAADVKDKDIDDFLKDAEDDNNFDTDEDAAEEESEKVLAEQGQRRRKGSGFLTMAFIVIAFGAAGAGAYMYLNRDEGMTSIMGSFGGGNSANDDEPLAVTPPPSAEATPVMPDAPQTTMTDPLASPTQPAPITNADMPQPTGPMLTAPGTMPTAPDATAAAPETTPLVPADATAAAPAASADVITLPAPADTPAATATATPAPSLVPTGPDATASSAPTPLTAPDATGAAAQTAVDDWSKGVTPNMPGPDNVGNTAAVLPEQPVAELKTKPPVTKKATQPTPAPEMKTSDASAPAKPAKARKSSSSSKGSEGALPPPYLSIQAGKGADTSVATTASAGRMSPVVEGGAHRDVEGNVNSNIADRTAATGQTAAMVAQGGGIIDMGSTVIPAQSTTSVSAQSGGIPVVTARGSVPAPLGVGMPSRNVMNDPVSDNDVPLRNVPLAINGGRSLPSGGVVQSQTYAQLPDTDEGTKPAQDMQSQAPSMMAPAPVQQARAPMAAPTSSATSSNDAQAIVAQAMAAEKSGDKSGAVSLYQKALEADAVYGDGKSIDRGMVYDRIGALRQ